MMTQFEAAAKEVVNRDLLPQPPMENMENIQVQLKNFRRFSQLRRLEAKEVSHLVCVRGIIVSAGRVRVKATTMSIMCRNCQSTRKLSTGSGFGSSRLPRRVRACARRRRAWS
jgi:DNA replication licensing factor MCM5